MSEIVVVWLLFPHSPARELSNLIETLRGDGRDVPERGGIHYYSVDGQDQDAKPTKNPIEIGLSQTDVFVEGYEHVIDVHVNTDIWTEESSVGEVNRDRLTTALGQLYKSLDVVGTRMTSDRHTVSGFEHKGFEGLAFDT